MTGLLLLLVAALWLVVVVLASRWVGARATTLWLRLVLSALCFAVLLPAPLLDELISYEPLNAACEANAVLRVDEARIRGRVVVASFKQHYVSVGMLKVLQNDRIYVDRENGEVLASYTWLRAKGGWLSRALTESQNPISFGERYECEPKLERRLEEGYQFTLIEN